MSCGVCNPGCCACLTNTVQLRIGGCTFGILAPYVISFGGTPVASGTLTGGSTTNVDITGFPAGTYTITSSSFGSPRWTSPSFTIPSTIPPTPVPFVITAGWAAAPGYVCVTTSCKYPLSNRMVFSDGGPPPFAGTSTATFVGSRWSNGSPPAPNNGLAYQPDNGLFTVGNPYGTGGLTDCGTFTAVFALLDGPVHHTLTITEGTPVP